MQYPTRKAPAVDPDGVRQLLRTDEGQALFVELEPVRPGVGAKRFDRFPLIPGNAVWR